MFEDGEELLMRQMVEEFGARVKLVRRAKGMSLENTRLMSGVSSSLWSQVERGEVEPGLVTVVRIATGLGADLEDLLDGLDWASWRSQAAARRKAGGIEPEPQV
jgi:transcriptional regulator with XRE-family HTH domain